MNSNIWDFFERKVCLTLDDKRPSGKPSRWPSAQKEFNKSGINNVIKFQALPAIGPHQSFTLSQKQILTDFINSEAETLLTLEDDVQFSNDLSPLRDAIYDIKLNNINWHVFYLGGNIRSDAKKYRRNLFKVSDVWTTHAVAYTRYAACFILANFPNENEVMYDNHLGNNLKLLDAFMINPMIATQRPDRSDIWGNDVDYTDVFKHSQSKMKL